jgi:hypothetical protein
LYEKLTWKVESGARSVNIFEALVPVAGLALRSTRHLRGEDRTIHVQSGKKKIKGIYLDGEIKFFKENCYENVELYIIRPFTIWAAFATFHA